MGPFSFGRSRGAVSISGSLKTMILVDLLQWAATAAKTGRFEFRSAGVAKEVFVESGMIVGAASNQPTELLGHFLVARGKLNEEQLRAALLMRAETAEFIGQILVRLGFVSQEELRQVLVERTEEIVYSLFEWDDAHFNVRPGPTVTLISLTVNNVLLRGVHRHDEMLRIRAVLPHGRVVLARTSRSAPPEILNHPLARRILDALNGRRTVDELAYLVHASPFPVMKFLYEIHRMKLATIADLEGPEVPATGETADTGPSELTGAANLVAARERLARGDPDGALSILEDVRLADDRDTTTMVQAAEAACLRKVYGEGLPRDAPLELTRPLAELVGEVLGPEDSFLLSRVDGRCTVREIVDIAPMRELDTVRALRKLLARGLVRVPVAAVR